MLSNCHKEPIIIGLDIGKGHDKTVWRDHVLGTQSFKQKCEVKGGDGGHCPEEGKHKVDDYFLCDNCFEGHKYRQQRRNKPFSWEIKL